MTYRLGVDLGTTFTSAAVCVEGGEPEMVPLGRHAMQVPSVLFLTAEDEFIVGEAAEARGAVEPQRMVREFKRRLGDQVPILIAGSPMSAHALQARLLSWVIEQVTRLRDEAPTSITLTHPANWGPFKRELFTQTIRMADVEGAKTLSEPEAAATRYASRNVLDEAACVAVYDLGGGTFDVAILRRGRAGFEILGRPDGLEHLGGIDFDEAVFHHVLAQLGDLSDLDDGDPELLTALSRLRRDCVAAKEALSTDTESVVVASLPGRTASITLTREELDAMIRPAIVDTIAAMQRSMRSAGVEASGLAAIVLTGGSSRIPLVSAELTKAFGRPLALDTHPKHDVALGAALFGAPLPRPVVAATEPIEAAPAFSAAPGGLAAPSAAAPVVAARVPPQWLQGRRRVAIAVGVLVCVAALVAGLIITLTGGNSSEAVQQPPTSPPVVSPTTTPQTTTPQTTITPPPPVTTIPTESLLITSEGKAGSFRIMRLDLGPSATTTARVLTLPGLPSGSAPLLPTISPDRSTVVFLVRKGKKDTVLDPWIATLSGRAHPLLDADSPCDTTGRPSFSPDGKRLVVVCTSRTTHKSSLLEIGLDGQLIGQPLVADGSPDGNPTWTNDGRIIFQRRMGDNPEKLWSVPDSPAPATPQQVSSDIGWDSHEDWSNAAHRLLFLRTRGDGGGGVIYVSNSSGAITPIPGVTNAQAPSWSPDGQRIAFLRRVDKHLTLWVMQADGSDVQEQSVKVGHLGPPAWDSR